MKQFTNAADKKKKKKVCLSYVTNLITITWGRIEPIKVEQSAVTAPAVIMYLQLKIQCENWIQGWGGHAQR